MCWAIFWLVVALASASLFRRLCLHTPRFFGGFCKGHTIRADVSKMDRCSARSSGAHAAADGWQILELWKVAEQRRLFSSNPPPTSPDWDNASPANIGLPESVALSRSDFRLAFTRGSAAVLVCLFRNHDDEIRVFLTKRAQSLSSHSGEVALPGGKRDKEDADDAATALREAKEEIGLDPSTVEVVTTVEPFVSKKLLRVTPVIGLLMDRNTFKPAPNPGEVDAVFDVPLEMFLKDDAGHRTEERTWFGYKYKLHFFDHEAGDRKFVIWGLTAAILIRCASVIYQRPPAFEEGQGTTTDRTPRL